MGLEVSTYMLTDGESPIPLLLFMYIDPQATLDVYAKVDEMYATGKFDEMEAVVYEYNMERVYRFARIYLLPDAQLLAEISEGAKEATVLGENDGYTYVLTTYDYTVSEKDDPAIVEAARVRVNEMIASMQYQPVVIPEEELAGAPETVLPNAFPSFTTQDLSGNTVDNSIFAKADLTVLNIWGTTCAPCITEMPELQEWSENMPENVQMMGLVLDAAIGDADTIETAQMICEATGVKYINLLVSPELIEFAQGIMFTPTTIFVDGNGSIVGEPFTGAYVDGYKMFVEEYFNVQ
jgi:thiol-disulfide isomerase/thioredoxin